MSGRYKHLGTFSTIDAASAAYEETRRTILGDLL
jgi:hypothetical protein